MRASVISLSSDLQIDAAKYRERASPGALYYRGAAVRQRRELIACPIT